jgi:hypothetical protein
MKQIYNRWRNRDSELFRRFSESVLSRGQTGLAKFSFRGLNMGMSCIGDGDCYISPSLEPENHTRHGFFDGIILKQKLSQLVLSNHAGLEQSQKDI